MTTVQRRSVELSCGHRDLLIAPVGQSARCATCYGAPAIVVRDLLTGDVYTGLVADVWLDPEDRQRSPFSSARLQPRVTAVTSREEALAVQAVIWDREDVAAGITYRPFIDGYERVIPDDEPEPCEHGQTVSCAACDDEDVAVGYQDYRDYYGL